MRRALRGIGVEVEQAGGPDAEVRVFVETLTREDRAAVSAAGGAPGVLPVMAVMTKADLCGFGGPGPLAAAGAHCRQLESRTGVPTRPLAALLAVAGSDPEGLDEEMFAALQALADGSVRPPARIRSRLRAELDLFGVAVALAAVRRGADRAGVRAELLRVSGVQAVRTEIERAVAAATRSPADDDVVLARMAAAAATLRAAGLRVEIGRDRADLLRQAVHWQRVAAASGPALHRDCARDIVRGLLRLWTRAGGRPERLR